MWAGNLTLSAGCLKLISLEAGVTIWIRVLYAHMFLFPQEETYCAVLFTHPCRSQEEQSLKGKSHYIIETGFQTFIL